MVQALQVTVHRHEGETAIGPARSVTSAAHNVQALQAGDDSVLAIRAPLNGGPRCKFFCTAEVEVFKLEQLHS